MMPNKTIWSVMESQEERMHINFFSSPQVNNSPSPQIKTRKVFLNIKEREDYYKVRAIDYSYLQSYLNGKENEIKEATTAMKLGTAVHEFFLLHPLREGWREGPPSQREFLTGLQGVKEKYDWLSTDPRLVKENPLFFTINDVACKAMPDLFRIGGDVAKILEIKTASNMENFEEHYFSFYYPLQLAFYSLAIKTHYPQVKIFKYYYFLVITSGPLKGEALFFEVDIHPKMMDFALYLTLKIGKGEVDSRDLLVETAKNITGQRLTFSKEGQNLFVPPKGCEEISLTSLRDHDSPVTNTWFWIIFEAVRTRKRPTVGVQHYGQIRRSIFAGYDTLLDGDASAEKEDEEDKEEKERSLFSISKLPYSFLLYALHDEEEAKKRCVEIPFSYSSTYLTKVGEYLYEHFGEHITQENFYEAVASVYKKPLTFFNKALESFPSVYPTIYAVCKEGRRQDEKKKKKNPMLYDIPKDKRDQMLSYVPFFKGMQKYTITFCDENVSKISYGWSGLIDLAQDEDGRQKMRAVAFAKFTYPVVCAVSLFFKKVSSELTKARAVSDKSITEVSLFEYYYFDWTTGTLLKYPISEEEMRTFEGSRRVLVKVEQAYDNLPMKDQFFNEVQHAWITY